MFERMIAYEAICEVCGHSTETFLPPKYDNDRKRQARASARQQGWVILPDDSSYCPNHKAAAPALERAAS